MRIVSYFLLLTWLSCASDSKLHQENIRGTHDLVPRYAVQSVEPPIVFEGAIAFSGSDGNWPFIQMQTRDNLLYTDNNASHNLTVSVDGEAPKKMGLGISQGFHAERLEGNVPWLEKGSLTWNIVGTHLKENRYYSAPDNITEKILIRNKDILECFISLSQGLQCRVHYDNSNTKNPLTTVWNNEEDPVIEITNRSYPGMYAVTKSARLLYFKRFKTKIVALKILHSDLSFVPNSQGRYFINSPSNDVCMKTDKGKIYCSEDSALSPGPKTSEHKNPVHPMLLEIAHPSFEVEEVAFGGRHFCFLSSEGELWCKGDNGCGQVTGRHDGKQIVDDFLKINFLANKVKQVFAHASGTCALLIDERVQCYGLGASVIRKRIQNDRFYIDSFSWGNGFRPRQVCMGGAEYGI